jgi:hypothetical protein
MDVKFGFCSGDCKGLAKSAKEFIPTEGILSGRGMGRYRMSIHSLNSLSKVSMPS